MTKIIAKNAITEAELGQIKELEQICRSYDTTKGSISLAQELNFHKDMNCFFLLYKQNRLIGLVSVFAPVKGKAEISALTHPAQRRQGHFKALLNEAAKELHKFAITGVYFVHDAASQSGHEMISRWNIAPDHSEYLLKFSKDHDTPVEEGLFVKETKEEDIDDVTALSIKIFGGDEEEWKSLHKKSFISENVLCFGAHIGSGLIGTGNVNITSQGLYIFCFGIHPDYRRKGYGRAFLYGIINRLKASYTDDILLEVDSENHGAFALYTQSGFQTKVRFDYYERTLQSVKDELC